MPKRSAAPTTLPALPASAHGWMVKQEPEAYSWADFVRDGKTAWTGVRNHQARNNLLAMKLGDLAFFYHSVSEKAVVGIAKVVREAYQDPTTEEEAWRCVDLAPVAPLPVPITLEQIKTHPTLKNLLLVKQSRLSVLPVSASEWELLVELAQSA